MSLRSVFRVLVAACPLIAAAYPDAQQSEPRTIEVVARRFVFEPAQIDVFVGEPVRLLVRSGDGVHGLEIKKLRINREIPRGGKPVTIEFTATEAGRFPILCSEYCGDDHDEMTGVLVVQARTETTGVN